MQAVAEAAKILNERKKKGWSMEYGWASLDKALAVLDGGKKAKCRNCGTPLEKCGPNLWKEGKKCCPDCTHEAVIIEDDGYPD